MHDDYDDDDRRGDGDGTLVRSDLTTYYSLYTASRQVASGRRWFLSVVGRLGVCTFDRVGSSRL